MLLQLKQVYKSIVLLVFAESVELFMNRYNSTYSCTQFMDANIPQSTCKSLYYAYTSIRQDNGYDACYHQSNPGTRAVKR